MGEGIDPGSSGILFGTGSTYAALIDPNSRRTTVSCGFSETDLANAMRAGPNALIGLAQYYPRGDACGIRARIDAALAALPPPVLQAAVQSALEGGYSMSFIGDLIGGIGDAAKSIFTNLPGVANTIAGATSAIQAIQMSLGGQPTTVAVNNNGTPVAMSPMMGMDAQAAFAAACNADPTGQCQAAISAALGGGMTMPINPTTGSPMIAMAGVAGGLTNLARQALMNPGVAAALRAVGLGGLIGAGEAGVSALLSAASGGGSAGVRGPLLMDWPAATSYPRGIVLRAPDKPEKRYRSAGAPLLLSGDVAAVRRVSKAAQRARRGRGRRSGAGQTRIMMLPQGVANVCGSCLTAPCGCK